MKKSFKLGGALLLTLATSLPMVGAAQAATTGTDSSYGCTMSYNNTIAAEYGANDVKTVSTVNADGTVTNLDTYSFTAKVDITNFTYYMNQSWPYGPFSNPVQVSGPTATITSPADDYNQQATVPLIKAGETVTFKITTTFTPHSWEGYGEANGSVRGTIPQSYCKLIKLPATQTQVDGDNNDTIGTVANATVTNDTGWVNNERTVSYSPNPGYVFADGAGWFANVTYHDGGTFTSTITQVPVTIVNRVPVKTTTTNTTNPVVTVQVDQYLPYIKTGFYNQGTLYKVNTPLTASQLNLRMALDDDNLLKYREDKALWGSDNHKFITVSANEVTQYGSFANVVKAKTGWTPTANLTATLPGQTVVKAWVLGGGATTASPWGTGLNVDQKDFDIATPKGVTTTTTTTAYKDVSTTTMVDKVVKTAPTPITPDVQYINYS